MIESKVIEAAMAEIVNDITDCICNLVRTVAFDDKTAYRDILKMVEFKLEIYDAE